MFNDFFKKELNSYEFKEKVLWLILPGEKSKKEIFFDFPIRQVVPFRNKILVRVEPDVGKILNENVYCFASDGSLLWQVKPTNYIDKDCPYTNVFVKENKFFFIIGAVKECGSIQRMVKLSIKNLRNNIF